MVQEDNVNLVPTDVINAGQPFAFLGPNIASALAQTAFGNMTQLQAAQIAAAASTSNAATSAGATIGAAGIGAQSRVDAQLIATNGAIAQNNAQMKSDAVRAAAGDIAAYRRLLQEQQYDSQLQNNKNKMEIAKLAGSGSLFDNIAARFAASGQGALPQIGGAFGLAGGIQNVSAPTGNAPQSIEEILSFIPQTALQSGGGTDYTAGINIPSGGGFGGGGSLPSIGDLFSGINESVFGSIQSLYPEGLISEVAPSAPTSPELRTDLSNLQYAIWADRQGLSPLANTFGNLALNKDTPQMSDLLKLDPSFAPPGFFKHGGGKIKKGESAIVGDDQQGRLTPFSELIKVTGSGVEVTPLNRKTQFGNFRGGFHTGTEKHSHTPGGISSPSPLDLLNNFAPGTPEYAAVKSGIASGGTYDTIKSSLVTPTAEPVVNAPYSFADWRPGAKAALAAAPGRPRAPVEAAPIGVLPGEEPVTEPVDTSVGEPDGTFGGREGDIPAATGSTDGVLSDINNIPALQALRGTPQQSIFGFGEDYFSRPELGIDPLPSPFQFGKPFLTMPQQQRNDVLEIYKSLFGLEFDETLGMFQQSQPGFRNFPRQAFGF